MKSQGYYLSDIQQRLSEEDIRISISALYRLIKKEKEYGTISDWPKTMCKKEIKL